MQTVEVSLTKQKQIFMLEKTEMSSLHALALLFEKVPVQIFEFLENDLQASGSCFNLMCKIILI